MSKRGVLIISTLYLILFGFYLYAGPYGVGIDYFYSLPIILAGLWFGGMFALFLSFLASVLVIFEALVFPVTGLRAWVMSLLPLKVIFFISTGVLFSLLVRRSKRYLSSGGYEEDILRNTFYALDVLEKEIEKVKGHKRPLTIAIIDLDNFKKVNEQLGKIQGDMLLRLFGKFLIRNLQPVDIVTR